MHDRFEISDLKFEISDSRSVRAKKIDEGRENNAANTLRGTLLLRMAISRTLAKHRGRHPLKAPCLHLSQIGTSIIKKQKERAFSLPGKLPAPSSLLIFALRFGSGSPLPLIKAYYSGDFRIFGIRVYRQKYWSLTP